MYAYRALNETEAEGAAKLYGDGEFMTTALRDRLDRQLGRMIRRLRFLGLLVTKHAIRDDLVGTLRVLKGAGCGIWVVSGDDAEACIHASVNVKIFHEHGRLFNVGEIWRRLHKQFSLNKAMDRQRISGGEQTDRHLYKDPSTHSPTHTKLYTFSAAGGQLRRELLSLLAEYKAVRKQTPPAYLCTIFSGKVLSTLLSDLEVLVFHLCVSE